MTHAIDETALAAGPLELDVADAELWQDPHAALRPLREHHPLALAPLIPAWFVLRYDEVERLLSDPRLVGGYGGLASGAIDEILGGLLANQSGEKHTRLRHLLVRALTPRQIDKARGRVRAEIERIPRGAAVLVRSATSRSRSSMW